MIVAGLMLVLVVLVVLIGTKEDEAIVLYYDAQDVTPEMVERAKRKREPEEADAEGIVVPEEGDMLAAVEEPAPKVKVTVGGAAVNSGPKKAAAKPRVQETGDDIRRAAAQLDPNVKRAQELFDDIRGGHI